MAEGKLYKKITLKLELVGIEELGDYDKMIIDEAFRVINENVGKKYGIKVDRNVTYIDETKGLAEVLYPMLSDGEKKILVETHDLKKQLSALFNDRY